MKIRALLTLLLIGALVFPAVEVGAQTQAAPLSSANRVSTFTIANAQGAATNETNITYTAKDARGNPVPYAVFDVWVSDQASGEGLSVTAMSGSSGTLTTATGVGISGACDVSPATPAQQAYGTCLSTVATAGGKKAFHVMANSVGRWVWQIVDSAKTLYYPVAVSPNTKPIVGTRLATASYK